MFKVSLDRMRDRRIETTEFAGKIDRLAMRLETQIEMLGTMKGFSEIVIWLEQIEAEMRKQAGQTEELGAALESVIRFYQNSERRILEHLEEGPAEAGEGTLTFTEPRAQGGWPDLVEF